MGVHYVIAGQSQCNLFAEVCLVGDYLTQNLPEFKYSRIEKSVPDWRPWLCKINKKNKWHHTGSPIIWKELLMPGSKPSYIGGASEFLEYCHSYYKFDAFLTSTRFEKLVDNYGQFQKKVKQDITSINRHDNSDIIKKLLKPRYTICISGAGNPLALFIISSLLENDVKKLISKIYIHDEKCGQKIMEFVEHECNYIGTEHSGKIVKYVAKLGIALASSDLLIILDYISFRSTYSIGEWLYRNKIVMENIAHIINATSSPNIYVVLPNIGPSCYNATILAQTITRINKNNIVVATSDLGLEIASVAAEIAEVPMKNMFCSPVWGFVGINHLVDIRTTIHRYDSFDPYNRYSKVRNSTLCIGTLTPEMRTMEYLMIWDETLWKIVAERKLQKTIIEKPVSIKKAIAAVELIKIWLFDPNPNYVVNLGIQCDGSFGLTFQGVFSQPAHLVNGEWRPASDYLLPRDPQMKISYLQQIAEIVMTLNRTDLPQIFRYTPCICKIKKPSRKQTYNYNMHGN